MFKRFAIPAKPSPALQRGLLSTSLLVALAAFGQDLQAADNDQRLDDFAANRTESGQPEVYARIQRKAATYRVQAVRNRDRLPMSYQTEAARALSEVEQHLKDGNPVHAYDWGEYYWHKFQYASVSPELLHNTFRGVAAPGRVQTATKQLVRLWYFHPEYPAVHEAMHEAMIMVEGLLMVGEAIDFTATEPGEIVQWEHVGQYQNLEDLLAFLARFGDRNAVAPRALLANARANLFMGADSSDRLIDAQIAYGQLLRRYPQYEQVVFNALCELALVHLISYKGDEFNVTELLEARWVLDRADLLTNDQPERRNIVSRYRGLVDRWTQDRDLAVGTWYDRQVYGLIDLTSRWFTDWGLADWKTTPEAQVAAQYYYRQTVRLGRTSAPAREAIRRIDAFETGKNTFEELSAPTADEEAANNQPPAQAP